MASQTSRPKQARVGHITFKVLWVEEKDWRREDEDKCGLTFPMQGEVWVRVSEGTSEDNLREILLHELLHCAYHATSLAHYPVPKDGEEELEEYTVALLSGPLLSVLRDNPDVAKYLTAK